MALLQTASRRCAGQ